MSAAPSAVLNIKPGDTMPDFTMPVHTGGTVNLADFRGKSAVVLFYYPKAHTGGCTRETAAFGEHYEQFKAAGAEVFGASADPPTTQDKFACKLDTPFGLLTDAKWEYRELLGHPEPVDKLVKRITYVIDKQGKVAHVVWFKGRGDVMEHITQSLEAVQGL